MNNSIIAPTNHAKYKKTKKTRKENDKNNQRIMVIFETHIHSNIRMRIEIISCMYTQLKFEQEKEKWKNLEGK